MFVWLIWGVMIAIYEQSFRYCCVIMHAKGLSVFVRFIDMEWVNTTLKWNYFERCDNKCVILYFNFKLM